MSRAAAFPSEAGANIPKEAQASPSKDQQLSKGDDAVSVVWGRGRHLRGRLCQRGGCCNPRKKTPFHGEGNGPGHPLQSVTCNFFWFRASLALNHELLRPHWRLLSQPKLLRCGFRILRRLKTRYQPWGAMYDGLPTVHPDPRYLGCRGVQQQLLKPMLFPRGCPLLGKHDIGPGR